MGFRPLTGIKVSEQLGKQLKKLGFSFRPLTGIKVSERGFFFFLPTRKLLVSVPSRGLRYLNINTP